jgi:hypothetical protein
MAFGGLDGLDIASVLMRDTRNSYRDLTADYSEPWSASLYEVWGSLVDLG